MKWGKCWCRAASLNNYKAHKKIQETGELNTAQGQSENGLVRGGREEGVEGVELHAKCAVALGGLLPLLLIYMKSRRDGSVYCGKSALKRRSGSFVVLLFFVFFFFLMLLSNSAVESVRDCMDFTRCPIRSLQCDSLLDRVSLRDNC